MGAQPGAAGQAADPDEWRHVRAVLAKRTPDSTLVVNRYAMGICPNAGGKAMTTLMRKEGDPNEAQVDNDLDALSILWNTADALLAALARERRRSAAMRAALEQIRNLANAPQAEIRWPMAEVRIVVGAALADDVPGRLGGEGEGHGQ